MLFSLPRKNIPTYSKIHINIPSEDITMHTHTHFNNYHRLFFSVGVYHFCWRKQYRTVHHPWLLFPCLSCLFKNFPWFHKPVVLIISSAYLYAELQWINYKSWYRTHQVKTTAYADILLSVQTIICNSICTHRKSPDHFLNSMLVGKDWTNNGLIKQPNMKEHSYWHKWIKPNKYMCKKWKPAPV